MQSRNWDGGAQERDTAVACVRKVFPTSQITPKCINTYPIRVLIQAYDDDNDSVDIIWEGDQKSLFRKYASRREAAQKDMISKLTAYKTSRL